ncbi:MAG: transposase family protein [bacterium]|nr:transposase family protein [bacterium]
MKHRKPRQLPKNLIWATDLTFVADELADKPRPVLGLIDHGTRACLRLQQMRTKASIALIREIFDAIERFGKPKILRTDNEAVFTSLAFRGAVAAGHQAPAHPARGALAERSHRAFLRHSKKRLRRRGPLSNSAGLQGELDIFRFWYNHARTHQHLDGRTPAMAWNRQDKPRKKARYFSAWEGVLTGFYFPT